MCSPVTTPIMFYAYEREHDPLNLAACTFIGHDRDLHGCECAHGLRPWLGCPAHRGRARRFQGAGLPVGGPYWAP